MLMGWYSSYWSEGSRNHLTFKIVVSNLIRKGLEALWHGVWRVALPRNSRSAAKPLLGIKFETIILKVRWFLDPSDQYELNHPQIGFCLCPFSLSLCMSLPSPDDTLHRPLSNSIHFWSECVQTIKETNRLPINRLDPSGGKGRRVVT